MPSYINSLMAIFFLFGAIGSFGLSQRASYQVQDQGWMGAPTGEPRAVYIKQGDRIGFVAVGISCTVASLYFLAKTRRNGLRR